MEFVEIVNSVGFPIAVCVALFYQNNKINENYKEMLGTMDKTIENNTLALKELSIRLENNTGGEIIG